MHFAAMRKKRKSVHLRFAPFLWLFLTANVAAGLVYSKVTSIVHVRTDGVKPFDRERVEGILAKLQDVPCSKVKGREIESQVMQLPEVDHAEFTRNPFGNGLLTVQYRVPVAKLAGTDNVVLSDDGILYPASEFPEDIPTLQFTKRGPAAVIALAGNWEAEKLSQLAVYAQKHYPREELKITVDDLGSVCLNIGSGRVVLGSCENLQLKLKTLEDRLAINPLELKQNEELILTWPKAPALVNKIVGKHK